MTFTNGIKDITFKTPYKDPERSELSCEGHDLLSSRIILSEDDYDRGCRKPSDLEDGFYKDTSKLGPEYVTGMDDEGEVTWCHMATRPDPDPARPDPGAVTVDFILLIEPRGGGCPMTACYVAGSDIVHDCAELQHEDWSHVPGSVRRLDPEAMIGLLERRVARYDRSKRNILAGKGASWGNLVIFKIKRVLIGK
ncbi:hypothetical protein Tco_0848898 [Tanacetum coccineum]